MSTDKICLLPDQIINQIAAGEVIQRPSSVVKELLENAIDAGATEIQLHIKDGGKSLIQVVDNGCGMSFKDAKFCFERHATSKIKTADDIFKIYSKGFRGEAMAAIASVAQVSLKTGLEKEEYGTLCEVEGGAFLEHKKIQPMQGTSISVKNLFFNTPARRNFLKNNIVENKNILQEFERVVLAHPEIHFEYYNEDQIVYFLQNSNLKQRIVRFFGKNYEEKLCFLENESLGNVKISGFVGKPQHSKKKRGEQFFFINQRFFKHNYFHQAVVEAFGKLLPEAHFPIYLIYLEVPSHQLDLNIHPAKIEIRFEEEEIIYTFLKTALRKLIGKYQFTPSIDFDISAQEQINYFPNSTVFEKPEIEIDPFYNPFEEKAENKTIYQEKTPIQSYRKKSNFIEEKNDFSPETTPIKINENLQNPFLFEENFEKDEKTFFIYKNHYICTVYQEDLILVDFDKAMYRIHFENALQILKNQKKWSKKLLFPIVLETNAQEMTTFQLIEPMLKKIGFEVHILNPKTLEIIGIPSFLNTNTDPILILQQLFEEIHHTEEMEIIEEKLIKSQNYPKKKLKELKEIEIKELLKNLFALENPNFCPNGKPIFFKINTNDIDKKIYL